MLKNKFGMTKVLALVLSVLMLATLAACGNDGMTDEEIQAAIDSAAKLQSEAAAKAESERLAAEAALKAQLESERLAAESSQKAYEESVSASISKAQAELQEQIDKATNTTTTKQTTPPPTSASTTEPKPDTTAAVAEFSKLKAKYTITDSDLYLDDNYEELVALFDKASLELSYATTQKAVDDIMAQLKTDVANVESAQTVANALQAQIAALGDIETAVFTTQYEMVEAAKKSYSNFKKNYEDYFKANGGADKAVTKLGVDIDDLYLAEAKIEVLEDYITKSLTEDLKKLYLLSGEEVEFDEDGDDLNATNRALIADAYYKYQVLAVVNGGDVSAANYPIEYDYKYDEETGKVLKDDKGNKILDTDKPIAWFTTDEFISVYANVYLDDELNTAKATTLAALEAALTVESNYSVPTAIKNKAYVATFDDVEDAYETIFEALEAEYDALTFTGDYKTTATLASAKKDVYNMAVKAYVEAAAALVEASKEVAIELKSDAVAAEIETLEDAISDLQDDLDDAEGNATKIERINSNISKNQEDITKLEAGLDAFIANVNAAAMYTYDELNSEDVRKSDALKADACKLTDLKKAEIVDYVEAATAYVINSNFVEAKDDGTLDQTGDLRDLIVMLREDLENFRDRLNPEIDYEDADDRAASDIFYANKGSDVAYRENWSSNSQKFADMVAVIDAAIETMEGISESDYEEKIEAITYPAKNAIANGAKAPEADWNGKALYYIDAEAKAYVEEEEMTEVDLYKNIKVSSKKASSSYLTTTANDYPLTAVYTAAEQAMVDVYAAYNKAYTDVFKSLMAIASPASTYTKLVTDKNQAPEYTAIKNSVSGDLLAEVEAFAKIYTDEIAKKDDSLSQVVALGTYASKAFHLAANLDGEDTHFQVNLTKYNANQSLTHAADFDATWSKIHSDMQTQVDNFTAAFFTDDTKTASNVVELWNHKTEAIAYITSKLANYKNSYVQITTQGDANYGKYNVAQNSMYKYDDVAVIAAKSANAEKYEAQLDSLLDSYISKIKAVKLNSNVELKNHLGKVILTKGGASINQAKANVNALVVDLLGYDNVYATYTVGVVDAYTSTTWNGNKFADSQIFKAWKAIFDTSSFNITLS